MKGPAPAPQLAGDIGATLQFFTGVETRLYEGWDRFGAIFVSAAAAANQSAIRLRNPTSSGMVAVFERIGFSALAGTIDFDAFNGPATTDLGTVVAATGTRLDARGRQQPALIVSNQNTAVSAPALTNQFYASRFTPPGNFEIILTDNQEVPLLPGDAVQFSSLQVNTGILVNLTWRERQLEESERT